MKQKISYSLFNAGVTATTIILWVIFFACFVLYWVFDAKPFDDVFFWIMFGIFVISAVWSIFIVPTSVSVDDENVNIHKAIKTRKIKISDIKSVEPIDINSLRERLSPFKWVSRFIDGGNGVFYYYYGKPKNSVIINFKDGKHFTVGTSNPTEFIEFINKKIK
ncbi:MAG: hypothetical protein J1E82_04680 [Muribaculaceae bacterium]|nr:hypothetical protein [Muribaculaceae bacterium]